MSQLPPTINTVTPEYTPQKTNMEPKNDGFS